MLDRAVLAILFMRTGDHGDQAREPCRPLDEARCPGPIAAALVADFRLADRRIAHDRTPQAARHGAEIFGKLDRLQEEALSFGEAIEEVAELRLGEAVVDVAVAVLDHGPSQTVGPRLDLTIRCQARSVCAFEDLTSNSLGSDSRSVTILETRVVQRLSW